MNFLKVLADTYGHKQRGDELYCRVDNKEVHVAHLDHKAGCWGLTPEGEKLCAAAPPEEVPVVDEDAKLQPHQKAAKTKGKG